MSIERIEESQLRTMNGSKFDKCYVFSHNDHTCMLFPFENTDIDVGRLAMWRLQNYEIFGGTWLSDYVPNRLGGFQRDCELIAEQSEEMTMGGM